MELERALKLFEESGGRPIRVCSPSGELYWLERDVVECVKKEQDPLVYGWPITTHPRKKRKWRWVKLKNLREPG